MLICGLLFPDHVLAHDETRAPDMRLIALGDLPYGAPKKVYPRYEALIKEINARKPDLVIHVGDTKGGEVCTNKRLDAQRKYMMSFEAPLLYTPGDNEWTDCFRRSGHPNDPLERLAYIRKTYFADPSTSFGKKVIALEHQGVAGYPENARMRSGNIAVITAHVVGSNNGFEIRSIDMVKEFFARNKATISWMKESFEKAKDAEIIVVAIHADMFEFDFNVLKRERWLRHSGFAQFGPALKRAARAFGKPVLLIFGDSHKHRVFQPFPKYAPNITAVEVYGHPDMAAVEISIQTGSKQPFTFRSVWRPSAK